nr:ligand-dependent nuclear receptor-interacting factor 1 [Pogona vitticeps]
MSEMASGVSTKADGKRDEGRGPRRVGPLCITGRVYHIVQMAGLNGEKPVKLLPVSKPLGNFVPLVQSQITADNVKGNTSRFSHDNLKGLFATTTFPFVKNPEHTAATPGKWILPKPFGQEEKANITSVVKENPPTPTVLTIQSNFHSADRLSFRKDVAPNCLGKNNTNYVLLNTKNDPGTARSTVLPSGHHLQIPAHAEVKSVPASLLPLGIQQKILAAAAPLGPGEVAKVPTVIYVSPVNTVKSTASKPFQNICPKSVIEATEHLMQIVPQRAVSLSTLNVTTSDCEKKEMFPIKWSVQENLKQSAPCLVAVKSSNSMVSKILKFLANMKNVNSNTTSILPASSNSLSESQGKITSIKDNALVVYNEKVYLLTKKEHSVASANNCKKQVPSNDETLIRKQKSNVFSSPADSTIANQVVSLVLSKNKGNTCSVKDAEVSGNMKPQIQSEVSKNLEAASPSLVSPLGSLQTSNINQLEAVSALGHVSELKVDKKSARRENKNITLSSEEPAALLPSMVPYTSEEEKTKTVSGMNIQIKQQKKQRRKSYFELRRKFGLFKEERVYLRRIPVSLSLPSSEESVCSRSVQANDTCDLCRTVPVTYGFREEEKIVKEQEELNIKRRIKTSPVLEHAKRKKTLNTDSESYTEVDNQSSTCGQAGSEQESPTCLLQLSESLDPGSNPCTPTNEEDMLNPDSHCSDKEPSLSSFTEDGFPFSPPDVEETIRDEKITKLKLLLREREVALEEFRKKTH